MIELTVANALLAIFGILAWMYGLTFALIGLAMLVEKVSGR